MKFTNFQLFQEIKGYSQISEKFNVPKSELNKVGKIFNEAKKMFMDIKKLQIK